MGKNQVLLIAHPRALVELRRIDSYMYSKIIILKRGLTLEEKGLTKTSRRVTPILIDFV